MELINIHSFQQYFGSLFIGRPSEENKEYGSECFADKRISQIRMLALKDNGRDELKSESCLSADPELQLGVTKHS